MAADPPSEVATALVWLTRLPVGQVRVTPLSQAVWAFPLVGLVVGLCGGAALLLADWLGIAPLASALIALAVMAGATGALHQDGLADYADGCGASTRARALEIMRDSHIGSYGVMALILVTATEAAALADLARNPWCAAAALIGAAAISRAGMALALRVMRPARVDGLGHGAGVPTRGRTALACAIGLGLLLPLGIVPALAAAASCAAAQILLARHAIRRLGGQTGDVLGALQQVGEVSAILAVSASLAGAA